MWAILAWRPIIGRRMVSTSQKAAINYFTFPFAPDLQAVVASWTWTRRQSSQSNRVGIRDWPEQQWRIGPRSSFVRASISRPCGPLSFGY